MARKTTFFERWSWFKFNNFGLAPGTNLKFYTSVARGSKLKIRKFWELIPAFVEVTGKRLVRGGLFSPPILNRRKSLILFINILWVNWQGVVLGKLLMRKSMDIPSVLFSFLEAALKLRSRVNETGIK